MEEGGQAEDINLKGEEVMPGNKFVRLYRYLCSNTDIDFYAGEGEPFIGPKSESEIRFRIEDSINRLPLSYREAYVKPLLSNLKGVLNTSHAHALLGAVYQHSVDPDNLDTETANFILASRKRFLAVVSNLYRSFLEESRRQSAKFPEIPEVRRLPPLVYFSDELSPPNTLTIDEVKPICGGTMAIVILSSNFQDKPLLWGILAHETAGHAILHADLKLMPEVNEKVRKFLIEENKKTGAAEKISREQLLFLERLWPYWLEEAVADVYAVLNLGPAYGFMVAAYQTLSFYQALSRQINGIEGYYQSRIPRNLSKAYKIVNATLDRVTKTPRINTKILADADGDLDPHPPDILRLYLIIGVVDALTKMNKKKAGEYSRQLKAISMAYGSSKNNKLEVLGGYLKTENDTWMKIKRNQYDMPLETMQDYARKAGYFIATEPLEALGGQNIQKLETWDDLDEIAAQEIKRTLLKSKKASIKLMGDDAQLLSGAFLALLERPNQEFYDGITDRLTEALSESFRRDPIWGEAANPIIMPEAQPEPPSGWTMSEWHPFVRDL